LLQGLDRLVRDHRRESADLLSAAEHKTRPELSALLAQRFPQPDVPTVIRVLSPVSNAALPGPGPDGPGWLAGEGAAPERPAPGLDPAASVTARSCQLGPDRVESAREAPDPPASLARLTRTEIRPLTPERYALQVTLSRETHALLAEAQALLGHVVAPGDVAGVLDRALRELVRALRKRRCAASERPGRAPRPASAHPRHVPAAVRRAVWARDGDRCTFVGSRGHRCGETHGLELDHVVPVARGGTSTLANLRLRCAAHNQHEAERVFGAGFMREKREAAGARPFAAGPAGTA
jgi:5-methylcytosine-specific restriction endonuclease McrA